MKFYLVRFEDDHKVLFAAMCEVGSEEYAEYRAAIRGTRIEGIIEITFEQAKRIGMVNPRECFLMGPEDDPYEMLALLDRRL